MNSNQLNTNQLESLLTGCPVDPKSKLAPAVQKALFLARRLQERATELQTAPEKRQQAELDRMLQTPSDKATLAQITDQAFRTNNPARAVEHLTHILDVQGVPRFFGPVDRTLMKEDFSEASPAAVSASAAAATAQTDRLRDLEGRVAQLESELKLVSLDAQTASATAGAHWD